jgi:hypothetical protein
MKIVKEKTMEIIFTKETMLFESPVMTPEVIKFAEKFPGFENEEDPVFPDEVYGTPENIRLSFTILRTLALNDQAYSYSHQQKFSDNAFDVIRKQPIEKQKDLFETFALETIGVINKTVRPRLCIQSFPVLEKLKLEQLLENFTVEVCERHYTEAERIYNNAKSSKTGLNVVG